MPSERDFYSSQGQFDVGPQGSPALLDCVAYKLCYYRFGQMQTEYGKPAGFDRARGKEIGRKNIELTTMEEAFTSEHWIVRIFKVKRRPNFETSKLTQKKVKARKATAAGKEDKPAPAAEEAKYVGCYASEASFGTDRVYNGGPTGANYNIALHHAKTSGKKYFAVARGGPDGHAFAFSKIDNSRGQLQGGGCERPCADQDDKPCGCIDSACSGPIIKGEEHNRRWAVYEVLPPRK
jgi:dolichyl-diphosphooligosaccharide--protein glycosyltransferase